MIIGNIPIMLTIYSPRYFSKHFTRMTIFNLPEIFSRPLLLLSPSYGSEGTVGVESHVLFYWDRAVISSVALKESTGSYHRSAVNRSPKYRVL